MITTPLWDNSWKRAWFSEHLLKSMLENSIYLIVRLWEKMLRRRSCESFMMHMPAHVETGSPWMNAFMLDLRYKTIKCSLQSVLSRGSSGRSPPSFPCAWESSNICPTSVLPVELIWSGVTVHLKLWLKRFIGDNIGHLLVSQNPF